MPSIVEVIGCRANIAGEKDFIFVSLNNTLLYEEIKKDKGLLEYFYKLVLGKEATMVELRQKVEELEEKLKRKGTKNNNGGSLDNK